MANPQKENGYVAVATEIYEALAKTQLSGQEWRILITLLRKCYGFHKKEDWISLSQFASSTGMNVQRVCESIKKLNARNIVTKKRKGKRIIVGFNKNYDTWKQLRKSMIVTENRNPSLRKSVDTIDTITKEKKIYKRKKDPLATARSKKGGINYMELWCEKAERDMKQINK